MPAFVVQVGLYCASGSRTFWQIPGLSQIGFMPDSREGAELNVALPLPRAGQFVQGKGVEMAEPTGLRITAIHNARRGASNENDEWVLIVNDGQRSWDIRGWILTDETDQQLRPHIYGFPATLKNGGGWTFDPGEAIYVFTGRGADVFSANPSSGRPQFHLHWGRDAMVWNDSGDRVYLRNADGTFVTQPFPVP